jgi:hypothetical protein
MWIISASSWLFKKISITMHGNMNVKLVLLLLQHSGINHQNGPELDPLAESCANGSET